MIAGAMDRYIAGTVLRTVGGVLACLVVLVTLFTLADELRDITPGYETRHALLYVLYSTPRRIYELAPYGVFIGALAGLGVLASREEITVLRSAGVSVARLFASAAAPALLLVAANQALGEFVAPAGETRAATLKLNVQGGGATNTIRAAQWHREGALYTHIYTHIGGYGPGGELLNIRQYFAEDGALRLTRHAESAVHVPGDGSGRWLLRNVAETRFDAAGTSVRRHDTLPWQSKADPRVLSAKALFDPGKLSFADLRFQISYLRSEGLDATRYQVWFWRKALQPLAVLGLVLLAVAFVVGPLREVGMGARLTVGIAVGLGFKYVLDMVAPMSIVWGVPPWLSMLLPVALCWALGGALARRV